uniref:BY PROTMAP: gi/342319833/gb/EGU11779.1/ Proteophosphoglycan ppg4 [Rhodotorula glutinis ATCC 204091] n=1 Tax=Rhodotorula toruloides TaxID=5286 RepID=A0A0K3CD74_RHOTO
MANPASSHPSSSSRPPLIRGSTDPQPTEMHVSPSPLDAPNDLALVRPRSAQPGQAEAVVKKALSSDEFVRRTKRGEQELGDDEGGKRRYVSAAEGSAAKKGEEKTGESGQAVQQQQRIPTSRPTSPVAHHHARFPRSGLNGTTSRSSSTSTSQAGSSSGASSSASSSRTTKPRSRSRLPLILPPHASHLSTPSSTPLPSPSSDTRPRSSLFLSLSLGPIPPCVTPTEVVACGGEAGGRALEAQVQETDHLMQSVGAPVQAPEKTLPSPLASPRNRVPLAPTPAEDDRDRPDSRPAQSRRPSSLAPMSTSRPLSSLQAPEASLPSPALSGSSSTNSFTSADYTGLACPVPVRPSRMSLAMQKSASTGAVPGRRRASGRSPASTSPPRHHDAADGDESKRPPIATFTSFEEAFGLSAPLSPPPSPPPREPTPPPAQQQVSKSWWPL